MNPVSMAPDFYGNTSEFNVPWADPWLIWS